MTSLQVVLWLYGETVFFFHSIYYSFRWIFVFWFPGSPHNISVDWSLCVCNGINMWRTILLLLLIKLTCIHLYIVIFHTVKNRKWKENQKQKHWINIKNAFHNLVRGIIAEQIETYLLCFCCTSGNVHTFVMCNA